MIEDTMLVTEINQETQVIECCDKVLYIVLYINKSEISVRDSNKQSDDSPGKVVILPNGVSIKHGKSERGNFNRRILDFKHLRYNNMANEDPSAYPDVIIKSFYEGFNGRNFSNEDLRDLEKQFNTFIKNYLSDQDLDINNLTRADWINRYPELQVEDFRLRRGDWRQLNLHIGDNEDEITTIFDNLVTYLDNNFFSIF